VLHGDGTFDYALLRLDVTSPVEFVAGDGLRQSFDLRPAATAGRGDGTVSEFLGPVRRFFFFTIDRLTVTPRSCKP
jgi:hypothetical protein